MDQDQLRGFADLHRYWRLSGGLEGVKADFFCRDLIGLSFSEMDFRQADLSRAYLVGGDFRGADFSQAVLRSTEMASGDFRGANFHEADVFWARIQGARGLVSCTVNKWLMVMYRHPDARLWVRVGCRSLPLADALTHWAKPHGHTREDPDYAPRMIRALAYLEAEFLDQEARP